MDGLKSSMEELCPCISDAFREKFDREIKAAEQPQPTTGNLS
jgi:hypothetical protein